MIRNFLWICFVLFSFIQLKAQEVFKEEVLYTDLKIAMENPSKVKRLSLQGKKLKKMFHF